MISGLYMEYPQFYIGYKPLATRIQVFLSESLRYNWINNHSFLQEDIFAPWIVWEYDLWANENDLPGWAHHFKAGKFNSLSYRNSWSSMFLWCLTTWHIFHCPQIPLSWGFVGISENLPQPHASPTELQFLWISCWDKPIDMLNVGCFFCSTIPTLNMWVS